MSSTGAGYDYSPTVYSPDGRMYQAEYAAKAVENAGTSVGIRCKDGVVLATEKMVLSKMLVKSSNRRLFTCDLSVGLACSGFAPDGRQLVNQARDACAQYKEQYGVTIPPCQLADRMSQYMHAHTCYHYLRPFGSSCLMAGYDEDQNKHELYAIKSDGLMFRMFGAAIGKGARGAQTEIERGKFQEKTCSDSLVEIAKIISTIHDDVKDKPYVLEMSWLCEATGFKHRMVADEVVQAAREQAEKEIRDEEEESDEEESDED
jgi:20S proteasome subunit alpha 7